MNDLFILRLVEFQIFMPRPILPSPSERIGKKTSQWTSRGSSCSIYHVDITLPDTTLLQRNNIRQQNRDDGTHSSSANTSNCSSNAKLRHALGQAASQAADAKDSVCKQEARLAAKNVAKFAVERLKACEGEEVSSNLYVRCHCI